MARVALDANVILRSVQPTDAHHPLALRAIARAVDDGDVLVLPRQALAEFWAVATRPVASRGLGLPPSEVRAIVDRLRANFEILPEPPETFDLWLDLVTRHGVSGKPTHDARLAATMLANGVARLLTFNATDFARFEGVRAETPA